MGSLDRLVRGWFDPASLRLLISSARDSNALTTQPRLPRMFNIFSGSPLMLLEKPEIPESFAKHHDDYKKIERTSMAEEDSIF